ncbi:hypothetical protein F4678DRAFT_415803 [Xylaria arbuscula]|nr:hypothetical protein F4678DRAFT_415803 [Xylaria arbuscula]
MYCIYIFAGRKTAWSLLGSCCCKCAIALCVIMDSIFRLNQLTLDSAALSLVDPVLSFVLLSKVATFLSLDKYRNTNTTCRYLGIDPNFLRVKGSIQIPKLLSYATIGDTCLV